MERISIRGTPSEMGAQLGKEVAGKARDFLARVAPVAETISSPQATSLWRYLERAAPDVIQEIESAATASNLTPAQVFYLSYLEDIPGPDRRWVDEEHCTVVIVRNAEEGTTLANTMDVSAWQKPLFHVRDYTPARGHRFVCTSRGIEAGCSRGMNEAGLAMGGASAPYGATVGPGLGLYVGMRIALQNCATVEEVIDLFRRHTVASKGHCYGVADASGAGAILEVTHGELGIRRLEEGFLCAVNRFDSPSLQRHNAGRGPKNERNCNTRRSLLDPFFASPQRQFSSDDANAALALRHDSGEGVCAANTQFGVLAQTKHRRFFVADGPTHQSPFIEVWHAGEFVAAAQEDRDSVNVSSGPA